MVPTYFRRELRDRVLQRRIAASHFCFWLLATLSYPAHVPSYPANAGYPVRRGFSVESRTSLEYWITRSSCAMAHKAGDDSGKILHDGNPVESRPPHRRAGETRCVERRAARGRGASDGQARPAVRDRAGHGRLRLLADPQRDRSGALDAQARRAGRKAGAAGGDGARKIAGVSRLVARRPADAGAARHPRAVAGRRRTHSRYHAGAAGGVRPRGPPHRLWRGTLRLHARPFAQSEGHHGRRHRIRGAGNKSRFPRCRTTWRWIMC